MSRIIYGSAGVAAIITIAAAALLFQNREGIGPPAAQAQSTRAPEGLASRGGDKETVHVTAVSPTVEGFHRVTTQPAQVEAYERTSVYAKASGFLSKILVDMGDRVEQGQVLAELWIPEMDQEQVQRSALVEEARAAVEQAQARAGAADALVLAAQAKLAEVSAGIAQYEAELAFRRSEHRRIIELVNSKSVTESLRDEKLKLLQSAEAALAGAQAAVQSAEAHVRVEHSRTLQARADVAHAQAHLKVAEANLRQTEILMEYARVKAPYAGLVTRRWVDTGDFVASAASGKSEPLFTVDRIDRLRIIFDVPESESALVEVGQRTSLVVDALNGRTFEGRIVRTAGVLDPKTRTLRVEAELDDYDAGLRAGMYGMITTTLAERPQTIMLPARAVRSQAGKAFVFRVNDGVVEQRSVVLGYADGTRTEILEGVGSEDLIVVESRLPIRAGQAVHVATP